MTKDRKPYPSETQDRYIVRFPDGMRDRIREEAEKNGRSMNAEIIHALQAHYRALEQEEWERDPANWDLGQSDDAPDEPRVDLAEFFATKRADEAASLVAEKVIDKLAESQCFIEKLQNALATKK